MSRAITRRATILRKCPLPADEDVKDGRPLGGKDDDDLVLVTYDDSLPADAAASARVHRVNVKRRPNVVKEPLPTVSSFLRPAVVIIEYCFKAKCIAELDDDDDTPWARHIYRLLFVTSGADLAKAADQMVMAGVEAARVRARLAKKSRP